MDNLEFKNIPEDLSTVEYLVLYSLVENKDFILDALVEDTSLMTGLCGLQSKLYIKLEEGNIELRKKSLELFPENEVGDFATFWETYHKVTGLRPTDKAPAETYWRRLKPKEKRSAIDNIEAYFSSLNDKRFCKKARTYLKDKNFDDDLNLDNDTDWTRNHK